MAKRKYIWFFFFMVFLFLNCEKKDLIIDPINPDIVYNPTFIDLEYSDFLPIVNLPEDNPQTEEGIQLGRMLFYDPILSGDSTLSCANCHKQEFAFTDENRFSTGIDGIQGDRNSMPIINIAWTQNLFWDGRANGVEDQALGPVENPIEMHETWSNAIEKLKGHSDYPSHFYKAFGTWDFNKDHVVKAIAQFERTLISSNSVYDKVLRNEVFFSDDAWNGYELFNSEKGDCFHCHGGILFTDNLFHNNALDSIPKDSGLSMVTLEQIDVGKFKTPTLRNIALTAPYMHDGRFETLEEVIEFYSNGLQYSETVDPLMLNVHLGGVQLNPYEKKAILAFLHTLTDTSFIHNPNFSNPF